MGYLKGPNDSHKIIIKIFNETSVNYCVKIFTHNLSEQTNNVIMKTILIPDPIIAQWAPLDD